MRSYDRDRQEWVGREREQELVALHERDAARQRTARRGAVAVLAACGLAFGTWALGWKDEPEPTVYLTERLPTQGPGTDQGTGAGAEGEGDTAPPSSAGGPPPAYEKVVDPVKGFRLAVPRGWTRARNDGLNGATILNYRSPDSTRRLQFYEVGEPTPYASLRSFLDDTKVTKNAGFKQLSLTRPANGPGPAARLTYLTDRITDEPDVGTWYVVDHRFEANDGKLYALTAYGADADGRQDERELVATALKWFCPPLTYCTDPAAD
ncbi:hypothetical protein [Streptomyces flavofungini]|uniref:Serine/arginine repetitive matrix protein 2 n=1 Tax=Streptomyces flavofungini TaxID=68200 RepID=A0ABS0X5H3_9ACTN|nr:hypothetical protein [Streptomyces flavofungini]MBJ3808451.1 hypothetical protein [Streptomyces flavofungini]